MSNIIKQTDEKTKFSMEAFKRKKRFELDGPVIFKVFIVDLYGEKAVSKAGKKYDVMVIEYNHARRPDISTKRVAVFTPECRYLADILEPGKLFKVKCEQVNGFSVWTEAKEI